jgi:Tfp pilus assembly protein PilV
MFNKKIKNRKTIFTSEQVSPTVRQAFSIGEVILSVFVLGVTAVSILALYAQGLRDFQNERDSIIAAMLAQEGVELVRSIRDNNWADRDGATDVTPVYYNDLSVASDNRCRIDIDSGNATSCNNGVNHKNLYLNSGFYTHNNAGTGTKFRRRIVFQWVGPGVAVTSLVSWSGADPSPNVTMCRITNKCVFSQIILRDWGTGT